MERRIDFLLDRAEEIHFHTFSPDSFKSLLSYFTDRLDTVMNLVTMESNGELVAIMKKSE